MQNILSYTLVLLTFVSAPTGALAWGKKGHATIAAIAEARLSPAARSQVQRILAADETDSMVSVASWADEPAVKDRPGRPMHTVRMSMDAKPYSDELDCKMRCAIKGINDAILVLSTPSSSLDDQIVALKDLIHLVGDIHQPLHTVSNIGGQSVIFKGEVTTLHTVWDNLIIRSQGKSTKQLAKYLSLDLGLAATEPGHPAQWAVEGRDIAMAEIYSEIVPTRKSAPATMLSDDYAERKWPIVEMRLQQAGVRLAATLESIYAN